MSSPFELATNAVESWLEGVGSVFVVRAVKAGNSAKKPMEWSISTEGIHPLISKAVICLPRDFPSRPIEIYVDKNLCLRLPHIEETGKVCLGIEANPSDYDEPVLAVASALEAFKKYIQDANCLTWVFAEFEREVWSYWIRFCDTEKKRKDARPAIDELHLSAIPDSSFHKGKLALYFESSSKLKPQFALACSSADDPNQLSARYNFSTGKLVRGQALFVRLSESHRWQPDKWPRDFIQLDNLIAQITSREISVSTWLQGFKGEQSQPFVVIIFCNGFHYVYQLFPPLIPFLTSIEIQPVFSTRIDSSWVITRGYREEVFSRRQNIRVLILGVGSIGAPVAELLAKAGVGHLTLVDPDIFLPENVSRHTLGLPCIGNSKAKALTQKLVREVPEIEVKSVCAFAGAWINDCISPGMFDLVVDCTGESAVRCFLSKHRSLGLKGIPIAHVWLEPFCAGAHVVYISAEDVWPISDPADERVNAADWPVATKFEVPACGAGFHPYGMADALQAAGFASERLLYVIEQKASGSKIWTWVRSSGYFKSLGVGAITRPIVPNDEDIFASRMITREFSATVGGG